jgi:hypothetical protein
VGGWAGGWVGGWAGGWAGGNVPVGFEGACPELVLPPCACVNLMVRICCRAWMLTLFSPQQETVRSSAIAHHQKFV